MTFDGHVTVVVEAALSIVKFLVPALALWLASPAKLALAVAVPALVLFEYVTVTAWLKPPGPVAAAVHGVSALPV